MVKYHKLFEVNFYHQFYDAVTSKDFEIKPLPNTQMLLQSFGIIYKQTNRGFILLYKEENERLFENLKKVITLDFGIRLTNKYFETFTKVSSSSESKKYLFSNRGIVSPKKTEVDRINLHEDSFISENSVCLTSYKSIVLSNLLEVDKVLLKLNDETIFEGELSKFESTANILGDEFGIYDVESPDTETEQLLYLPNSFSNTFGIIDLVIGGDTCSFDKVKGSDYQINFDSRKTQWNYFFISRPDKLYDSVELYLGKKKMAFSPPELVTLINGQQALRVMSEDLFPLRQHYNEDTLIAELKSSTEVDLAVKKINLTTPDITRIKGKRENGAEIYFSDMYIYL